MISSAVLGCILLVITLVLFITQWIPATATAIVSITLFALTGAASYNTCVSGFSNNIIIMLVSVLIVGQAMLESGLATLIGQTCFKLSKGSEKRFLLYIVLSISVMSAFMDNTTTVAVLLPVMASAVSASKREMNFMNLVMPASIAAIVGGACLLIGCTVNLTGQSILTEYTDYAFSVTDFTVAALPVLLLVIVYVLTIGYKLGNRIWNTPARREAEHEAMKKFACLDSTKPVIDRRKCITMGCILLAMVCMFLFTDLPLGLSGSIAAMLCVLFRVVDLTRALPMIDWDVVIRLACTLGLAAALKECGFCDLISNAFISVFGSNVSPMIILTVVLIASNLMSQFIGNSTVVLLLGAAVIPIVVSLGYSPLPVTMALTLGASFAWMTPIAGACIGISFSGGYEFNDYARYTWPLTLLMYIVLIIWLPIVFPF